MKPTEKVVVVLTGIGGGGHGEQILKALRLGELDYFIVGTDISEICANRGEVDAFHTLPRADHPDYLDHVLDLAARYNAVALFHGSEQEMMRFGQERDRITDAGLYVPVNSLGVLKTCRDKHLTAQFLERSGYSVPPTIEVTALEDVGAVTHFPAIVKPAVGGGSANVHIVQSMAELQAFVGHLLDFVPKLVVQDYVGRPDEEYTVGVLFGADGTFINSIAVKRRIDNALSVKLRVPNRSSLTELGPQLVVSSGVSQGDVGRWPGVTGPCEKIARLLGATAPVNIQCRLVGDQVVPFEINPRFSGTTSLRALAGYNEPDVLVRRDVFNEEIEPRFAYQNITVMRALREDIVG